MTTALFKQRFEELTQQWTDVLATKAYFDNSFSKGHSVDAGKLLNWSVKAKSLIANACGTDSEHYRAFEAAEKPKSMQSSFERAEFLAAIFQAAKEDYEGGYLSQLRNLVQAEVFSTELEQATELLGAGYATAAAVIAGTVLETTLRQLCDDRGIQPAMIGRMNDELAKAGCYNRLVHKRITMLAEIRNSAAHGHPERFAPSDVKEMITAVHSFVADQL
jgi:hypothetical protein